MRNFFKLEKSENLVDLKVVYNYFFRKLFAHSLPFLSLPLRKEDGKQLDADDIIAEWRAYKVIFHYFDQCRFYRNFD